MKGIAVDRRGNKTVTTEGWRHRNAFESYLHMGPNRSIAHLAKETGFCGATLHRWAQIFGWAQRVEEADKKAVEAISRQSGKAYLEGIKKRHQEHYQQVQKKAMAKLNKKKVSFEDDKDAAIALDIGIKGERDVLGLRDTKLRGGFVKEGFAGFVEMITGSGGFGAEGGEDPNSHI